MHDVEFFLGHQRQAGFRDDTRYVKHDIIVCETDRWRIQSSGDFGKYLSLEFIPWLVG